MTHSTLHYSRLQLAVLRYHENKELVVLATIDHVKDRALNYLNALTAVTVSKNNNVNRWIIIKISIIFFFN